MIQVYNKFVCFRFVPFFVEYSFCSYIIPNIFQMYFVCFSKLQLQSGASVSTIANITFNHLVLYICQYLSCSLLFAPSNPSLLWLHYILSCPNCHMSLPLLCELCAPIICQVLVLSFYCCSFLSLATFCRVAFVVDTFLKFEPVSFCWAYIRKFRCGVLHSMALPL